MTQGDSAQTNYSSLQSLAVSGRVYLWRDECSVREKILIVEKIKTDQKKGNRISNVDIIQCFTLNTTVLFLAAIQLSSLLTRYNNITVVLTTASLEI